MDQMGNRATPSWRGVRLWHHPLPSRGRQRRRQRIGPAPRSELSPAVSPRRRAGTGADAEAS